MNILIDFFAVRPVFTLYGIRVIWGLYILDQLLPIVAVFSSANLTTVPISALIGLFLHAALNIALFRLLIEVAAVVVLGRPPSLR